MQTMKKKIMKSIVATFTLAILFTGVTFAQGRGQVSQNGERPSPEERAERMTEKMTEHLGLNDYQADQVAPLNLGMATAVADIKDSDQTKEEKRAAVKAAMQNHDEQIKGILTDEQYEKFAEARKRRLKKKKGQHQGGNCPKNRPERS
jgi:hypothetical protein